MICTVWMATPPVVATAAVAVPLEQIGIATGIASIILLVAKELTNVYGGARLRRLGGYLEIPIISLLVVVLNVLAWKIVEAV